MYASNPTRTAVVPGPTTGAPPEPTREHHKGTPLRTPSAIGAHFVKRLIPGHIPASFPTVGCARAAKTSLGWRIHRAFCDVCEPSATGAVDRTKKLIC